jgi:mono/diheme cytochrome c family protein
VTIATVAVVGFVTIGAFYRLGAQSDTRSVWDGVYTEAQAARGHALFDKSCASCHGDSLEGRDEAPALAGADFLSNWTGLTAGDLFERIRTTMPLNNPGGLSRPVLCDILAYMLSANKYPSGKTELPAATEVLRLIRIDQAQPDAKK